jgi:aarF domain-containing kinase
LKEYYETFKPCQDSTTPKPLNKIKEVVEKELGRKLEDVFLTFSELPIAAASLAQVHKATLKDGTVVAVKVQTPRLQETIKWDILLVRVLIKTAEFFFEDLKLSWISREFELNLPNELDFRLEAKNNERIRENFKNNGNITTPNIHWEYTKEKVLTMEFIEGFKLNNKKYMEEIGVNKDDISRMLSDIFSEQIFKHGFVRKFIVKKYRL